MVEDIVRKNGLTTLGSRLRRLGERLQSEVQDLFDQSELPIQPFQYPLLLSLNDNGAMEIGQIARALGVTQPGVTRSVAQLTDLGCVEIIREVHEKMSWNRFKLFYGFNYFYPRDNRLFNSSFFTFV